MPRLVFEKTGDSVWISHLDLMRVFQRAFRRAGLHVKHSQGYTPRAIVSIALPLSVGVESCCELLDYELETEAVVTPELLNQYLPEGICVLDIVEQGRKVKELTHLRARLTMEYDRGVPDNVIQCLEEVYHKDSIVLEKHSKRGMTQVDIIPMIKELTIRQKDEHRIEMETVVCAQNPSLNPQMLVTALEVLAPELAPDFTMIKRLEVLDTQGNVFR